MKKLKEMLSSARLKDAGAFLKRVVVVLWKKFTHNLGLKLLSLLLAILMWNFVTASDTTRTRNKTVTIARGYVSGESTLNDRGLALAADPEGELEDIDVVIEVTQSDYTYVSQDNVQVSLALSTVRQAGTQEVRLNAATTYGKVVEIYPAYVTCTFEPLESREVPVNAIVNGVGEDSWYEINNINPSYITVSGPKSLVQSISAAIAHPDTLPGEGTFTSSVPYTLTDANGEKVEGRLSSSSSSVRVSVTRYSQKEISVSVQDAWTGQCAEGYTVTGVSVQPSSVSAAASGVFLDGIDTLRFEPVNVDGASQSVTAAAKIKTMSGIRHLSTEEVYVTVTVEEEKESVWVDDIRYTVRGCPDGMSYALKTGTASVLVTGPRSAVQQVRDNGLEYAVDLSGRGEGVHRFRLTTPVNGDRLQIEPASITLEVTLSRAEGENG